MTIEFYAEYKKNTKKFQFEEPFDFFIFRPLAFIILKFANWSFLRPDHFSLMALIIALATGYFLSIGTTTGFIYAGIGIFIFSVLDCCDGMLARMKKNGNKYGDLIDMFVDLLASTSFYIGLFIGLGKTKGFFQTDYLALVSAFFILFHASIYNFYKKQFFFYLENNPDGRTREIEKYSRDLERLNEENGNLFHRLLLSLFLLFSRVQKNPQKISTFQVEKYLKYNKSTLPMWGIISGSTHLMILSISLIIHRIGLYFFFAIVLSNMWLIFAAMTQAKVNKLVEKKE